MREEIQARLRASRKYRTLCDETVGRIAGWAAERGRSVDQATHLARRKLHQIYGAFWNPADHRRIERALQAAPEGLEESCRAILALHASTRERLGHLDRCYREIFAITGLPESVADLSCGLNPFALPWMGLTAGCRYMPSDIDGRLAELVNRLLERLGRPQAAECLDLLGAGALPQAEVCLLLKSLPTLERQAAGSAARVAGLLRCRWAVLSFPNRSLGGRDRGMREAYRGMAEQLAAGRRIVEIAYPSEVFYLVRY